MDYNILYGIDDYMDYNILYGIDENYSRYSALMQIAKRIYKIIQIP